MAWNTPKTNWSAADGVRDADFNRIEGNILDLYNNAKLRSDIIIYVSGTGNDTTGTGTASSPYATITKALSMLPKDLGGRNATINIASGIYSESVYIVGFNGLITLTGSYGSTVTISGLTVDACTVRCFSITLRVVTNGVLVTNGATFMCSSTLSITGGATGLLANRGSTCIVDASLSVSNNTTAAIHATNHSNIYALQITTSDSAVAVLSEQGSSVAYANTNMSVTVATFVTRTGGRIYTGTQVSGSGL